MSETSIAGVSLFTKERGKNTDVFELALTYDGIEIRRPAEEPRFLPWERITEWEIEQRRGGVLLVLRGSGSVTPLTIPRWKVDALDQVLRDVTTHWAQTQAEGAAPEVVAEVREVREVREVPTVVVVPEVREVSPAVDVAQSDRAEQDAALAHEFDPKPDAGLAWRPTVEPHDLEREIDMEPGIAPVEAEDPAVAGTLVWPNRSPLGDVPDLTWPSGAPQESTPPDPGLSWSGDDSPRPKVRVLESTPEPVPVAPAEPKVVIRPVEGAPDRMAPAPVPTPRAARRKTVPRSQAQPCRKSTARLAFTISLLSVLAVSVALILAQSAGAVHLSFLGFTG